MNEKPKINPWRVLVKGLIIFIVLNILLVLINPPIRSFILFNNSLLPGGYQRLPVLWIPDRHSDNQQFFERGFIDKIDLMLAAHEISGRAKAQDEYRVIIYGDSSVWGTALYPNETLAGQLNTMKLTTCDGKRIVTYNLGYPSNAALKDLVIMDQTQKYQPDVSLWLFSMLAFTQTRQIVPFIEANPVYSREVITKYDLNIGTDQLPAENNSILDETIFGKRLDFHLLVNLYASRIITESIGTDDPRTESEQEIILQDTPRKTTDFYDIQQGDDINVKLALDTLPAAFKIAEGNIIYVNEPIFTTTPVAGQVAYNSAFPIWIYDEYRSVVSSLAKKGNWTFYDYWNNFKDNSDFSTSLFHLRPAAEHSLALLVGQDLVDYSCKSK